MEPETVTIPKSHYAWLVRCEHRLAALESGGVDNWQNYGESLRDYLEAEGLPEDYWWDSYKETPQ